jgi:hypothetical protein
VSRTLNELTKYCPANNKNIQYECIHKFTDEEFKIIAEGMPFSNESLSGFHSRNFELVKTIIMHFGHNERYSNFYPHDFVGCEFKLPFDIKKSYSGETAPYCGHGYSGYKTYLLHYLRKGYTKKEYLSNLNIEWDKKEIDEMNVIIDDEIKYGIGKPVETWFMSVCVLGILVQEVHDQEDHWEPDKMNEYWKAEKILEEFTDDRKDEYKWIFSKIHESEFEKYRYHGY